MSLDKSRVLLKAVMQFSQGGIHIVSQPSSLGKQELGVCEAAVLLCHILQKLDCLNQILRRCHVASNGFGATVH
jgi:hypothetical protein